jgi:hypothetical protein
MLHVVFTEDGIPDWIGTAPRAGSEEVDKDLAFLIANRRTAKGTWTARSVTAPPKRTEAELIAEAEAERAAALAARNLALRVALAEEADPMFFKWQRGECRKEDWLDAVAATKARFPKP